MKKKYEKPKLSSLNIPIVKAQGFEVLGVCSNGNLVGDGSGTCIAGELPNSYLGNCSPGSGDAVAGSNCIGGGFAGTGCSSGTSGAE